MEKNDNKNINFLSILCLIFITLKLCKVIDWSWWWVFAPLCGQIALSVIICIAAGISKFISDHKGYCSNVLSSGSPIHWDYRSKQMYDSNGNVIESEEPNDN